MTPYATYVNGQDPAKVMQSTLDGYRDVISRYTPGDWSAPWAEGKWTAHQVLVHVAEWEMIFSSRVRIALAMPDYTVQAMEQDDLLNIEAPLVDVATATAAFEGLRRMNIALVKGLTPDQRSKKITHPERGEIDINDLIVTLAGHAAHHLTQLTR